MWRVEREEVIRWREARSGEMVKFVMHSWISWWRSGLVKDSRWEGGRIYRCRVFVEKHVGVKGLRSRDQGNAVELAMGSLESHLFSPVSCKFEGDM